MKKFIALALTLLLIFTLIVPASAVTSLNWDWGKARGSINNAATDLIREEQQPTEVPETEYIPTEVPEVYRDAEPEPVAESIPEREQSWRDWLRNWMHRMHYGEG